MKQYLENFSPSYGTKNNFYPKLSYYCLKYYYWTFKKLNMKQTFTLLAMVLMGTAFSQSLPIGFESNPPAFTTFGNSTYAFVSNPDASGINTSATVLETVHGNETWAGMFVDLSSKLDFTTDTVIRLMVWAPDTGTFRLKLEDQANSNVFWEADQAVTSDSGWVQLTWDLSGVDTLYNRLVIFPGWGVSNAGTFYVDNIQQGYGSTGMGMEENVVLMTLTPNPANSVLSIDFVGAHGAFQIMNFNGQTVAAGSLVRGENQVITASLPNGMYLVRVAGEQGETIQKLAIRH